MHAPRFRYSVRAEPNGQPGFEQVVAEIVGTHSHELLRRARKLLPQGYNPDSITLELEGVADGG